MHRPSVRIAQRLKYCHRCYLSTTAPYRSSQLTAQDAADQMMSIFGGKSMTRRQLIDANQLQKLALTLGRPHIGEGIDVSENSPPDGTPVPQGYHLVYFTPNGLESELGKDGTDRTFNAPSPFTRRMWAGGVMKWPTAAAGGDKGEQSAVLRVGDVAEERTKLLSAVPKKSRSGDEFVLVEVEKEFWTPRGLALVDQRSWVFRPQLDQNAQLRPPKPLNLKSLSEPTEIKDIQSSDG